VSKRAFRVLLLELRGEKLNFHNPKKFWSYVQSKTKTRTSIPDLYIDSDKKAVTSSDSEKANVLADFFSSVFTEEDDLVMPELDINPYIPKLDILNISTETIKKKLDNLKIDKSPGPDNIHPRILRKLSNILSEPLSIIYNNSFTNSVCPDEW
jgi:hypothetical protein